jgi:signal transduction histidine kinase
VKKFAIDLRVRVGYGTAFLLLLVSYLLTLYANSEVLKQARLVDHSNKIIIHVQGLVSALKDAETGLNGYLLMKDKTFLRPYDQSKDLADSISKLLENETWEDQDRQASLNTLKTLIEKKYLVMDSIISGFDRNQLEMTDPLRLKSFFSKELMDHIRSTAGDIQFAEQARLQQRSDEMTTRFYTLYAIILTSLAITILMAIYGFLTYHRENKARRIADRTVFEYQEQLKERIDELDKANKELIRVRSIEKFAATGRIARTIAHEVRNPLTNINLAVDQLRSESIGLQEDPAMILDMISRNSIRINQLITDLLNSTKFTELVYKKISINQLLDETLELAMDRVHLNDITIIRSYSSDICDVSVDAERMQIAFLNIIVNAIEAMEPGKGVLQIKTFAKEDKCVVTITDNGLGMDKESLSKIFEPYFTNKPKGTGLGLTNTQNIILNHNGHIHIDSEKDNGTSFTITLDFA